ncbi:hypothetical protein [Amycolatopsis echigonensis]|uniref:Uncharacterized protein n=1 Tax=Amycolatopsis echigonensis TaxID=2576905 RepID=A0A8E2B732_9PSEU|nr:hypothetical protein [Amycolatopsis echigonensis]MBB2504314.1 hypothetical protein [Amycolatopsis echigonensis]
MSVETQVTEGGGRATVDFHRGATLPGDVPDEQLQWLLRLGHIEPVDNDDSDDGGPGEEPDIEEHEPAAEADRDVDGDEVDLSAMDKDQLLAYAEEHGIAVDKRLGVDNLRGAITVAQE